MLVVSLFLLPACSTTEESVPVMEELVTATIQEFGLNPEAVSVAYYNYQTDTDFFYNERTPMLVGSVTKVGVARLYADLIADGVMSSETELPYNDALFDKVGVAGSSPARSIFKFLIPSMNYLTLI